MSTKNLIVLVGDANERNLIEKFATKHDHTLDDWTRILYPESGMHPDDVMEMTDDYIDRAIHGGTMIVETYSEHIVNRLVRRVVEDGLYSGSVGIADLVQIYFVHSDEKNSTQFEEITIDPDYGIVDWPKGFCDQKLRENQAIIKAIAIRSRKN